MCFATRIEREYQAKNIAFEYVIETFEIQNRLFSEIRKLFNFVDNFFFIMKELLLELAFKHEKAEKIKRKALRFQIVCKGRIGLTWKPFFEARRQDILTEVQTMQSELQRQQHRINTLQKDMWNTYVNIREIKKVITSLDGFDTVFNSLNNVPYTQDMSFL
jgi:hypothetical protein